MKRPTVARVCILTLGLATASAAQAKPKIVGHSLLGLDPVIPLGALTGAMTSTPALDMVNRQAGCPLPTG